MIRRGGPRGTTSLVVAIVLMIVIPFAPSIIAAGSALSIVRFPIESLIVVVLLSLVPWRAARVAISAVYGVVVVVALALGGLDAAFEYALDIHFDPTDLPQVNDGFGVVQDSIGRPAAILIVVLLAIVAVVAGLAVTWAALRVDAGVRRNATRAGVVTSAITAVWAVTALAGAQLVAGDPVAGAPSVTAISAAASRASASETAAQRLPEEVKADPYAKVPSSDLLTSLRGKDVVIAFIESYGQVAVQNTSFSGGVDKVLRNGQSQLASDGYLDQSAWLTSPTFGGLSWLAHSTLQTGLWVNKAPLYSDVIRSKRFTLSDAFANAGWRTVSDVPSDTQPWSFGTSFYHYDTLYDTHNVGYQGPQFGYAKVPDQYTWQYFYDHELAKPHKPVMAEIDFVSSHTPWAPLPQLVPWAKVGNGSVYDPQPAESESSDKVWENPATVQQFYGQSVQYSLQSMFSFLHTYNDPNLVLIVLGDHQPATIVSGKGANHQVPISIISKDPKVFTAISGWNWQSGDQPTGRAPLWRMDAFRDRFLTAFDKKR